MAYKRSPSMDFDLRTSTSRSKFIQDRVTSVEKAFGEFCNVFGGLARKYSKTRDKGDELSKHLLDYSETLTYNTSCKVALSDLSQELAGIQDYQDTKVKRIEAHVIEPLMLYNSVIKQSRTDIKAAFSAYDKEQKTKKQVDRVRQKHPSDRQQISQAETQLQRAQVDATRTSKLLEEAIDGFEQKKLKDIKRILASYITTEMAYHARALEIYTRCFEKLDVIDAEEDLEEFRNVLHPSTASERLAMMRMGGSRGSLQGSAGGDQYAQGSRSNGGRDQSLAGSRQGTPGPRPGGSPVRNAGVSTGAGPPQPAPRQSMNYDEDSEDDDESYEESSTESDLPAYKSKPTS